MRNSTAAVLAVAGFGLGALTVAGFAQDARRGLGTFASHVTDETYDLSVGRSPSGRPSLAETFVESRTHVIVPEHYGALFQVTQDGKDAILWYRADDGTLRNAVLDASSTVAYQVDRGAATKMIVKLR